MVHTSFFPIVSKLCDGFGKTCSSLSLFLSPSPFFFQICVCMCSNSSAKDHPQMTRYKFVSFLTSPPSLFNCLYSKYAPVYGYIGGWSIHRSSEVWLPRYPPMGADVGVFQVADAPTYGYVCTLPFLSPIKLAQCIMLPKQKRIRLVKFQESTWKLNFSS